LGELQPSAEKRDYSGKGVTTLKSEKTKEKSRREKKLPEWYAFGKFWGKKIKGNDTG